MSKKQQKHRKYRFNKKPNFQYSNGYKIWECKYKKCSAWKDNYLLIRQTGRQTHEG